MEQGVGIQERIERRNEPKVRLDQSKLIFQNQIVPEYITTRAAASLLGVSENALRIKVCRGQVPAHRFGRSLRFRMSEIARLFQPKE